MEIDPRGPRFGAVITTVVLAVVLPTGSAWLLAAQLVVFAVGALRRAAVRALRPALPPPGPASARAARRAPSPRPPPRFAQGVGMVFAVGGVGFYAPG